MISIACPLIGEDEQIAIAGVLASGMIAQGPKVAEFEERFAEFAGTRYAVATTSGTTALHVALLAHEIGPGDEVITSPFSFIASANCILYVGARPVFADIEEPYFTMDPEQIRAKITPRTRAILPVHLYGQACEMEAIKEIAAEHNLAIIEDACQAHGAKLAGKMVGSWGTACYSFYPTKNMTTVEGGMITTDDAQIAERARLIRNHGSPQRYFHTTLGYNFRMTDVQAAVGIVQLGKLPGWNETRRQNAAALDNGLMNIPGIEIPAVRLGAEHVYHQYTIRVADRDVFAEHLKSTGIGFGIHYPLPIPQQPLYARTGYSAACPVAETASQQVISLPVHPALTGDQLDQIIQSCEQFIFSDAPVQ